MARQKKELVIDAQIIKDHLGTCISRVDSGELPMDLVAERFHSRSTYWWPHNEGTETGSDLFHQVVIETWGGNSVPTKLEQQTLEEKFKAIGSTGIDVVSPDVWELQDSNLALALSVDRKNQSVHSIALWVLKAKDHYRRRLCLEDEDLRNRSIQQKENKHNG